MAVGSAGVAAVVAEVATGDSSAMLPSATVGETLSNFFFNFLFLFASLHLPQVMSVGSVTVTPLA